MTGDRQEQNKFKLVRKVMMTEFNLKTDEDFNYRIALTLAEDDCQLIFKSIWHYTLPDLPKPAIKVEEIDKDQIEKDQAAMKKMKEENEQVRRTQEVKNNFKDDKKVVEKYQQEKREEIKMLGKKLGGDTLLDILAGILSFDDVSIFLKKIIGKDDDTQLSIILDQMIESLGISETIQELRKKLPDEGKKEILELVSKMDNKDFDKMFIENTSLKEKEDLGDIYTENYTKKVLGFLWQKFGYTELKILLTEKKSSVGTSLIEEKVKSPEKTRDEMSTTPRNFRTEKREFGQHLRWTYIINGVKKSFGWKDRHIVRTLPNDLYISGPISGTAEIVRQIIKPDGLVIAGYCPIRKKELGTDLQYVYDYEGRTIRSIKLNQTFKMDENMNPVFKSWRPSNDIQFSIYQEAILEQLRSPQVVNAYVDQGKLLVWLDPTKRDWQFNLQAHGLEFEGSGKGQKRYRNFLGGHQTVSYFKPDAIIIKVMDKKTLHKTHDGAGYLSKSFIKYCLRSSISKEELKTPSGRIKMKRMMKATSFIIRIATPTGEGYVKMVGYVISNRQMMNLNGGEYCDVLTSNVNLKKEVKGGNEFVVMLDGKRKHKVPMTSPMPMGNLQEAFSPDKVILWGKNYLWNLVGDIKSNKLMEDMDTLYQESLEIEDEVDMSIFMKRRTQVLEWASCGLGFEHGSTTILKGFWDAKTYNLLGRNELKPSEPPVDSDKISIPIPYARFLPILPYGFAKNLYEGIEKPKKGQILYEKKYDICIITDKDAVENMRNHGGNDWDDEFYVLYRYDAETKEVKALVYRIPNSQSEFAVYNARKEDVPPCVINSKYRDKMEMFHTISFEKLGTKLTERTDLQIGILPKTTVTPETYTKEFVESQVRRSMGGANPGGILNILMMLNNSGLKYDNLPCSSEDIIDSFTQGHDTETIYKIQDFFFEIYSKMISEEVTVDPLFLYRVKNMKDQEGNPLIPHIKRSWLSEIWYGIKEEEDKAWKYLWSTLNLIPPPIFLNVEVSTEAETIFQRTQCGTEYISTKEYTAPYNRNTFKEAIYKDIMESSDPVQILMEVAALIYTKMKAPHKSQNCENDRKRSDWILTGHQELWDMMIAMLRKARNHQPDKEVNVNDDF